MQQHEIYTIVKKSFKLIEKLFPKIITDFEIEDTRKFRIEIQKLQAFLHLFEMGNEGLPIIFPKKLKTFYGYISIVRNLKLHLEKISAYFENSIEHIPTSYIVKVEKELGYWKENTRQFIGTNNNFRSEEENILATLPERLQKAHVKRFIHNRTYELQALLTYSFRKKDSMHKICKLLEDFLYNEEFMQLYVASLSTGLPHRGEIDLAVEMLHLFEDKCIDLRLIQAYQGGPAEENVLLEIMNTWQIQKQELQQIISDWLDLLQLCSHPVNEFI